MFYARFCRSTLTDVAFIFLLLGKLTEFIYFYVYTIGCELNMNK